MSADDEKRQAAEAALEYVPERGIVGLGTGSTTRWFIDGVGRLVQQGRALSGVPTSEASRKQAEELAIPLLDDAGPWNIDVCVDGADEVDAQLNLIKGGGGAQTREKIVNQASRQNIIVIDETKLSTRLGERWPVPIEVLAFGHASTARALTALGEPRQRLRAGAAWRTDAGNYVYDLHCGPIDDPAGLDARIRSLPGVVETGLFVGRADVVIVAGSAGVRQLRRTGA